MHTHKNKCFFAERRKSASIWAHKTFLSDFISWVKWMVDVSYGYNRDGTWDNFQITFVVDVDNY